ncbi:MAG: eukaryotic-like serine/threonine-protein kinase, partial [Verrucomicrobiota bacterium]|nr:eukaryotic-like serine/threonine-protein kinase [Verrucomicrobiota bacterium]
ELREKISSAALFVAQERFEEADKLLNEIPLNQPSVEGAAVLRSITEWHALRLQWRQAAERGLTLLKANPLDGSDVSTLDCLRSGPALIELGDINSYERFRQEAIARYSATPCLFTDRIVKVSLLLPANERLLESLRPLADETNRHLAEADRGGDDFTAAWRSVALGLLEYRRGNHAKAAEWSRRCLAYSGTNAPRSATAQIILAMASHRLGRTADARTGLAAGREIIEHKFRSRLDLGSPVHGFWFDWAFARILLRECSALLETPGAVPPV